MSDILAALDTQSRIVGSKGILIFAIATHGVGSTVRVSFTATSMLAHYRDTTLSDA